MWFMCGWQVKVCDRLVTRGPYLSALETHVWHYKALYKFTFFTYFFPLPLDDYDMLDNSSTAIKQDKHNTV